jgi:hypothetical protein
MIGVMIFAGIYLLAVSGFALLLAIATREVTKKWGHSR